MEIRDSVQQDVDDIEFADRDVLEARRLGLDITENMHRTISTSLYKKTALFGSVPMAMWGVVGDLFGTGMPYLTISRHIKLITTREFVRIYKQEVREMLKFFPRLENVVDAEYENAVRMLKIAGFRVTEPVPVFPSEALFRKFEIEVLN